MGQFDYLRGQLPVELLNSLEDESVSPDTVDVSSKASISSELLHVYVNSYDGSDNKDGLTENTAKKSLVGMYSAIPPLHETQVIGHIKGVFDTVGEYPNCNKTCFGFPIILDGGDDVVIVSGPHIADIASTTSIGLSSLSLTTDELFGYTIQILDGPAEGQHRSVYSNTATTFTPSKNFATNPGACTFQIVRPATTLNQTMNAFSPAAYVNYQRVYIVGTGGQLRATNTHRIIVGNGVIINVDLFYASLLAGVERFDTHGYHYNPNDGSFIFDQYVIPAWIGTAPLRLQQIQYTILSGLLVKSDLTISSSALQNLDSGSRIMGTTTIEESAKAAATYQIRNSGGHQPTRLEGSGVGLLVKNFSDVIVANGVQITNNTSHGIEVDNASITLGSATGSGNGGAGMYIHRGGKATLTAVPTITGGAAGEVSLDGSTQQALWSSIAGTPINGSTVGNDEFVVVK